jgi:hypothetical protein
LIQVQAAWEALKAMDQRGVPVTIEGTAPVNTVLSEWLETPHEGVGIFQREGWKAGDQGEVTVTLTRTSGATEPMEFAVTWLGNDGTYSNPAAVTLPLNRPVELPVTVTPRNPGAHSALLTLDHPNAPGHAYQMMATVVAAHQLDQSNDYQAEEEVDVYRPGRHSFYFRVPEETSAFKVDVKSEGTIRANLHRPDGRPELSGTPETSGTQTRVITNPMPGVWEVLLWATHEINNYAYDIPTPLTPLPTTITATLYRVDAPEDVISLSGTEAGMATAREIRFTNRGAEFGGAAGHTPLGSALESRPTIRHREQQLFTVEVPEGSTELIARIGSADDPAADLDLFLFDCTGETCSAAASGTGRGSEEWTRVVSPKAGTWKVVVDGARVAAGTATYDYLDLVINPIFGGISVADPARSRAIGEDWSATANIWLASMPEEGRVPYGIIPVVSDGSLTSPTGATAVSLGREMERSRLGWLRVRFE